MTEQKSWFKTLTVAQVALMALVAIVLIPVACTGGCVVLAAIGVANGERINQQMKADEGR